MENYFCSSAKNLNINSMFINLLTAPILPCFLETDFNNKHIQIRKETGFFFFKVLLPFDPLLLNWPGFKRHLYAEEGGRGGCFVLVEENNISIIHKSD